MLEVVAFLMTGMGRKRTVSPATSPASSRAYLRRREAATADADKSEDYAARHPWPLLDHEAGGGPVDHARALANPQQSQQHGEDAKDK